MNFSGSATPQGTERYRRRFGRKIPPAHFHQAQGLWMSSIGIGTYLGDYDDATDQQYRQAIVQAVEAGCNVIDSAINYRLQRSERAIGAALSDLAANDYQRDEIIIASKGGFIPFDTAPPKDARRYIDETFIQPGLASPADVVSGCHCMTPGYLTHQLDRSLRNLNLEMLDIYYLHNPETQLGKIPRDEFDRRLVKAFEALEGAVSSGKIVRYGVATWNCFRHEVNANDYLSLADVVAMAEKAGGKGHHFKVVQLPFNLGMSEALSSANQPLHGHHHTLLEAAQDLGIAVMCSASMLQGQLTHDLPSMIREAFGDLETDAQRALQFVRSTPGVTTALVGMKETKHVEENLHTARVAPASWEQYSKLFQTNC